MTFRMSTDIGGTFTDLYLRDEKGNAKSFKTPTTHDDLTDGIFNALNEAADAFDLSVEELLESTDRFTHGTTIATNAIIEDTVSKTALITTEGFRDTLTFREGGKENPYEWQIDYPDPYIPRSATFGVRERITAEGEVHTPLDDDSLQAIVEEILARDIEAVAVSLLWSHVNPVHEQRIGEYLDEVAPGLDYSLSHKVNPIIREYRRASSTAIDASLFGPINDYLGRLNSLLDEHGYEGDPLIITANGGVMQLDEVARRPIWTVDSGPTMLPVSSHRFVETELGRGDVLALDMGGTSTDLGLVTDGVIPRTREAEVADSILGIEKVEVVSIGAGGGSIAWVDDGGLLHVGPKSAGSYPGPACYLRGGERPTVTDAALALGYLNEAFFLGGEMEVDLAAAEDAIQSKVGAELGLGVTEAAEAIYGTAIQNICNGVEEVTIGRGVDPRNYVLSGGGGALGMVVVPVAREFQIDEIILPREAGVVSAIGGLFSDIRRDFSASHFTTSATFDFEGVNDQLADLEATAQSFLDRVGVPETDRSLTFNTEAHYPQQVWEIEVELPASRLDDRSLETVLERFHREHEKTYGFKVPEQEVEFLYWRVEANGHTDETLEQHATDESVPLEDAQHGERTAYFDGETYESPAYRGDALGPDHNVTGPAFIDAKNTTIVLPPQSDLSVTEYGNYHIKT